MRAGLQSGIVVMVQMPVPYILHAGLPGEDWPDYLFIPGNEDAERERIQIFQK